jgi:hypothetical protein
MKLSQDLHCLMADVDVSGVETSVLTTECQLGYVC